ncbi:hypothetical protein ABTY61_04765 [Kitasatospora sp. NPDC096128]|uniref:hypothetical protein n=1 Tax=Kitasatospora sp. NPDC096128 TaxID=3155547 RepID=UPI0033295041
MSARQEQEVDEAIAEGERGEVFQDGDNFLQSLADDAGPDLAEIKLHAGVQAT